MSAIASSFLDRYVDDFPKLVPLKMAQSFVAASAVHLLLGASVNVTLIGGAVAALATAVEAIARPVFKTIFPDHSWMASNVSILAAYSIAVFTANAVAPWLRTADAIGVFGMALLGAILFNNEYFEKNGGNAVILSCFLIRRQMLSSSL